MSRSVGRRGIAPWAVSLFLLSVVWTVWPAPVAGQRLGAAGGERPSRVRVKYRPGHEAIARAALRHWRAPADVDPSLPGDQGGALRSVPTSGTLLSKIGWHVYRLRPGERADAVAARLAMVPEVLHAEPVQQVELLAALPPPNDPAYNEYEPAKNVFPLEGPPDSSTWLMQWNLHYIDALDGWRIWPNRYYTAQDRPRDSPVLAILDTGIDPNHPDFMNAGGQSTDVRQGGQINFELSRKLLDGELSRSLDDLRDEHGHGTHVAGIAAAAGNNGRFPGRNDRGYGVIGVGYNAQIMVLKVADAIGTHDDTDVIEGILFAADNGALVLNLSLAVFGQYSQALQDAVNYAWAKGCVIVAASGNDGVDFVRRYPAACDKVVAVGATSGEHGIWSEQRAQYSTSGLPLSVAAPGGDMIIDIVDSGSGDFSIPLPLNLFMMVWSAAPTYESALASFTFNKREFRNYGYSMGTSMAAPHVAGLAALYAGYRQITPATPAGNLRIMQAIERGAENLSGRPNGGWEGTYGFGRINVGNTMKEVNARGTIMGTITGQVYYNATAVPNASITATPVGSGRRVFAGSQSDGVYRLFNLPAGDYDVRASFFGQVKTRRVSVVAGANTPGVTFYLGEFKGDVTAPTKPSLTTNPVAGSSPHQVRAEWWARDPETGIDRYEYAIGSTPGGTDVVGWTPTHLYNTTLTLPAGTPVRAHWLSVRAANGEGLVGEAVVQQIQ